MSRSNLDALVRDRALLVEQLASMGCEVRGASLRCPSPDHDDRKPSASITEDETGHVRVRCHACGFRADLIDLTRLNGCALPVRPAARNVSASPRLPAVKPVVYATLDELVEANGLQGFVVYRGYCHPNEDCHRLLVLRRDWPTKSFRLAHQSPAGYVLSAPQGPLPLAHRYDIERSETILVVEGERCVEGAARQLHGSNIAVTTSAMGANAARRSDWSPLRGKDVVIWPDHDVPGVSFADDVTGILMGMDASMTIARIDVAALNLPPGGDVVDFIAMHDGEAEALLSRLMANALLVLARVSW